ncbi:McrC family protein [Thermodesulfobacteriota bacterium]
MESITLIEHETLPIVQERSKGQKALSVEHADALGKLEKLFPPKTFSWGHRSVKFAHYCGVISLGNLTLEILPKIYGKETEPGACRKALIKMLVKTRRLITHPGGPVNIALQKHALLDVFILHFCDQLHAELMQGMIRHYVERNENLKVLRGCLRVEQQFKYNLAHRERLYCQYDELSADNPHNQVIKHVLQLMIKVSTGLMARKKLTELLLRFEAINDVKADIQMIDSLTFNRTTCRYEHIFDQCRWFLQGLHPDVLVGPNSCITLLFDMNRLFESFVAKVLRKLAWADGKRLREQGPQKYMVRRGDSNEQLFLMKPDMVFLDSDNRFAAIADAKWKMLDDREKKIGISQSDLYQMAGYAMRYGVDRLALVYPRQQYLQNAIDLQLQGCSSTLKIIPVDVTTGRVPKIEGVPFWNL